MNGSAEPAPTDHSDIPTFGARIRADESWLENPAVLDFVRTRGARLGCVALALGLLCFWGRS